MTGEAPRGRDLVVDGDHEPDAIGAIFAAALGLPTHAVTTERSSDDERQASPTADGWIAVHRLGPGGDFRFKVDVDLFCAPVPVERFPLLARRHGLTIAWCVDEDAPNDWHYHVAFPDGSARVHWLLWEDTEEGAAARLRPPLRPA